MDLTTSARVKLRLQPTISMSTTADSALSQLITQVSRACEVYARREFEWIARTEYYDVLDNEYVFFLHAWPARTAAGAFTVIPRATITVYNDSQHETSSYTQFPSTTALDQSLYAIDSTSGAVRVDKSYSMQQGWNALKITYTSGMNSSVTSAATFVTAYPEIALAVENEVVDQFRRMSRPDANNIALGGASLSLFVSDDLSPYTKAILDKYRRSAIG